MLQQLTDDYEFDESKGKLTEHDVGANATGTVSGMLFPLYISYIHSTLHFYFVCVSYFKVAGFHLYLSCVQDEAVFSTGEKKAKWIFVRCGASQSELYSYI